MVCRRRRRGIASESGVKLIGGVWEGMGKKDTPKDTIKQRGLVRLVK